MREPSPGCTQNNLIMHCFDYVHENNGVGIIDWNKSAMNKFSPRKDEAVLRYFKEDPIENPYFQSFV